MKTGRRLTPFGRQIVGGLIIGIVLLAIWLLIPTCYGFGDCDP